MGAVMSELIEITSGGDLNAATETIYAALAKHQLTPLGLMRDPAMQAFPHPGPCQRHARVQSLGISTISTIAITDAVICLYGIKPGIIRRWNEADLRFSSP